MHKVLVASTAHQNSDDMVYYRYARLFRDNGFNVTLVTMQSELEHDNGIRYVDIPYIQNPLFRMTILPKYVKKAVSELDAGDIFIYFSIDLNRIAINASKKGIKVIKVFAEDYSRKAYSRDWIPQSLRGVMSRYIYKTEIRTSKHCHLNVFVDSATASNYKSDEINSCVIPNYPINVNSIYHQRSYEQNKQLNMVYVGGISEIRGIYFLLSLVDHLKGKVSIDLFGNLSEEGLLEMIKGHPNVHYRGFIPYDDVLNKLHNYDIGLAIFKPCYAFDYIGENTTKLFEYMQAGLPVITSDVGLLKDIVVNQTKSGIAIDYSDFEAACIQIESFLADQEKLLECSINGRSEFENSRNWDAVSKELLYRIEGIINE